MVTVHRVLQLRAAENKNDEVVHSSKVNRHTVYKCKLPERQLFTPGYLYGDYSMLKSRSNN
jgi:hypothetical protein